MVFSSENRFDAILITLTGVISGDNSDKKYWLTRTVISVLSILLTVGIAFYNAAEAGLLSTVVFWLNLRLWRGSKEDYRDRKKRSSKIIPFRYAESVRIKSHEDVVFRVREHPLMMFCLHWQSVQDLSPLYATGALSVIVLGLWANIAGGAQLVIYIGTTLSGCCIYQIIRVMRWKATRLMLMADLTLNIVQWKNLPTIRSVEITCDHRGHSGRIPWWSKVLSALRLLGDDVLYLELKPSDLMWDENPYRRFVFTAPDAYELIWALNIR
jgi:hypothetical protein